MTISSRWFENAFAINSSLNPFPYVSAASNNVTPRSNALCMREIASPSVKLPHQPVEMVHNPNPTSLTVRSVFLNVRNRIDREIKRSTLNPQHRISNFELRCRGVSYHGNASSLCQDRKSTRLNSSHITISYAVFCLKKKKKKNK